MVDLTQMLGFPLPDWRQLTCVLMLCTLPGTLLAQEPSSAILHPQGNVTVNGNPASVSWTLAKDDSVQTNAQGLAEMDASGSSVSVAPDTLFSYDQDELALAHGTLMVNTNRRLKVRVGCVTIWPVKNAWTKYDVTDAAGKIHIVSHQSDVFVEHRSAATQQR